MTQLPPRFEWDPRKARENVQKHGVTFHEATSAFDDPHHILSYDMDHSETEDRFLLLGMSEHINLLTVVHVERGQKTRFISARRATPRETLTYAQNIIKKTL